MNRFKIILPLILLFFITLSCEKEIDLNLPAYEPKVVVEGSIENDQYAWVFLSKNHGYLENIDFSNITNLSFIEMIKYLNDYMILPPTFEVNGTQFHLSDVGLSLPDVLVTVENEDIFDTLVFEIDSAIYHQQEFVFPPVKFVGKKIKGRMLGSYKLTVKYGEQTFTATTTIPKFSEDWYTPRFKLEKNNDTLGQIYMKINDEPAKNYYRFFAKREGKDSYFVRSGGGVFDDQFFNGNEFEFPLRRISTNTEEDDEERALYSVNDSVTIKCCTLDHDHYWFWLTAIRSGNSFFGQPGKILGNISGGALGAWGGYGVVYKTIKCIPE